MRRLNTPDVFNFVRLIKLSGTKSEFAKAALMMKNNPSFDIEKLGAELILGIIEGLGNNGVEEQFYITISGPLEMEVDELKEIPLLDLLEKLREYLAIEPKEAWSNFFDFVALAMKKS